MEENNEDIFNPDFPGSANDNGGFGLPENYFSDFQQRLFSKLSHEDDLTDFPLLQSIPKCNSFLIPDGFFEAQNISFYSKMAALDELKAFPTLQSAKENAFYIPENYFSSLKDKVLFRMECNEELNDFSLLSSIVKENAFSVPNHYFNEFPSRVLTHTREAKIVSLWTTIKQTNFSRRWAYAASFIAMAGMFFLWKFSGNDNPIKVNPCNELACLEKSEILKSGFIENMDEESLMELLQDTDRRDTSRSGTLSNNEILEQIDASTIMNEL